jgi:hypothetical protein
MAIVADPLIALTPASVASRRDTSVLDAPVSTITV